MSDRWDIVRGERPAVAVRCSGQRGPTLRRRRSDLGELPEPALQALAGSCGSTHDEDRIVAADGPEHIGPGLSVECGGDRLGTAGYRTNDNQLADAVDPRE